MTAIGAWFERHGRRQDGKVVIDVGHVVAELAECTVEITESTQDSSARRRAFRFAHETLDASLESQRSGGKPVPVEIPAEH